MNTTQDQDGEAASWSDQDIRHGPETPLHSKTATDETSSSAQVVGCVIMSSFHLSLGFALGFSAILIPQLEHPHSDIMATKAETSWIASIMVLLVPIGALLAGVFMEYLGRVKTIQLAAIPCVLGWSLISLSGNVYTIIAGRVLVGISAGMATSPAIVYITEVANPKERGMLISTGPGLASIGILCAYVEGAFINWRIASWSALLYILLPTILARFYVPESPLWLVAKGRRSEASEALKRLGVKKSNLHEQKLREMVRSQELKPVVSKSFSDRLYKAVLQPTGYKPLLVLNFLFFFQQFSGTYITLFFAVTFFEDVRSGLDPSMASILVGCMRVVMSLCMTILMKKYPRRPLFMVSTLGMGIFMVLSGAFTFLVDSGQTQFGLATVICILLYVCASMIGLMSIPWTMTAEMFPMEIRGIAHGVVISVAHLFMFLALQLYRPMIDVLGGAHMVQWFFAIVCLGAALFIWVFVPETHNQKLADIQQYFKDNSLYIRRTVVQNRLPDPVNCTEQQETLNSQFKDNNV